MSTPPRQRIAIFMSGSGSNASSIAAYFRDHPSIEVAILLSNNTRSKIREIARQYDLPYLIFNRREFYEDGFVKEYLKSRSVDLLVLAGFLWLVPEELIEQYDRAIINIHPALLPRFGGKGMYGMKVHEAVLESGDRYSGITIHLANEHYDEGDILLQEQVDISGVNSPEEVASLVLALEHKRYAPVIERFILGELARR